MNFFFSKHHGSVKQWDNFSCLVSEAQVISDDRAVVLKLLQPDSSQNIASSHMEMRCQHSKFCFPADGTLGPGQVGWGLAQGTKIKLNSHPSATLCKQLLAVAARR